MIAPYRTLGEPVQRSCRWSAGRWVVAATLSLSCACIVTGRTGLLITRGVSPPQSVDALALSGATGASAGQTTTTTAATVFESIESNPWEMYALIVAVVAFIIGMVVLLAWAKSQPTDRPPPSPAADVPRSVQPQSAAGQEEGPSRSDSQQFFLDQMQRPAKDRNIHNIRAQLHDAGNFGAQAKPERGGARD